MQIKDKVVIVTGASGGIGEAVSRLLSQKGAKVALVARSQGKLEKLERELDGAKAYVCDMSKPEQIKNVFAKIISNFGGVDILVNNAGRGYDALVENIDPVIFRGIFDLDVLGYVLAMQGVIPSMRRAGTGSIVNISSGTALMNLPNMGGYSSLKKAVAAISLAARTELEEDNIKVSVVYPYITDTNFEENTIVSGQLKWPEDGEAKEIPPADSAEFAAETILRAIETGDAQVYAHKWMMPKA